MFTRLFLVIPINSLFVVGPAEKLQLLEGFWAGEVALNGRVHLEELVEGRRPSFLGSDHQEVGEPVARLGRGPDVHVSVVVTGVLIKKI